MKVLKGSNEYSGGGGAQRKIQNVLVGRTRHDAELVVAIGLNLWLLKHTKINRFSYKNKKQWIFFVIIVSVSRWTGVLWKRYSGTSAIRPPGFKSVTKCHKMHVNPPAAVIYKTWIRKNLYQTSRDSRPKPEGVQHEVCPRPSVCLSLSSDAVVCLRKVPEVASFISWFHKIITVWKRKREMVVVVGLSFLYKSYF